MMAGSQRSRGEAGEEGALGKSFGQVTRQRWKLLRTYTGERGNADDLVLPGVLKRLDGEGGHSPSAGWPPGRGYVRSCGTPGRVCPGGATRGPGGRRRTGREPGPTGRRRDGGTTPAPGRTVSRKASSIGAEASSSPPGFPREAGGVAGQWRGEWRPVPLPSILTLFHSFVGGPLPRKAMKTSRKGCAVRRHRGAGDGRVSRRRC